MIAHQGGWDEILLVLGPIAVIVGLLMLARKRVDATEQNKADDKAKPAPNKTTATKPTPKPQKPVQR